MKDFSGGLIVNLDFGRLLRIAKSLGERGLMLLSLSDLARGGVGLDSGYLSL